MKKIILAVAFAAISLPALAARSITAQVNGLVCSFCAASIEKRLKSLSATKAVYVNLDRKVVAVELKDGAELSSEKVAAEIKEAGYDVISIERSELSIGEIRNRARAKK
jgi:mercuric ion binding protein